MSASFHRDLPAMVRRWVGQSLTADMRSLTGAGIRPGERAMLHGEYVLRGAIGLALDQGGPRAASALRRLADRLEAGEARAMLAEINREPAR